MTKKESEILFQLLGKFESFVITNWFVISGTLATYAQGNPNIKLKNEVEVKILQQSVAYTAP